MTTRDKLAKLLEDSSGEYISGRVIAEQLGMTRSAIWKNIKLLEEDGYVIEAVTNRGYRLSEFNDVVSENCIRKYLGDLQSDYSFEVHRVISSTNTVMKERADTLPDWHVIISGCQTDGRGRSGRSFFSPADSGVYLSVIQRPFLEAEDAVKITTAAAVSACRAIEDCTDTKPEIKWVNDVFIGNRKVCGILTEASFNMETGVLDWVIMGIGFNVYEPEEGFPEEISETAGAIVSKKERDLRSRIAVSFMKHFINVCRNLNEAGFINEYRKRSFLIGMKIFVLKPEGPVSATAEAIDDECRLVVRYDDGREEKLSSGEVSIRPAG